MSRTVVITGANRGIGLEHVRQALAAGEQVIATCRHPGKDSNLVALATAHPGKLAIHPLEVIDPASIAAFAQAIAGQAVDRLINNAGVMGEQWGEGESAQKLGTMDYDLWEEMLRINLIGPVRVTEALLPNLRLADGALVVMMSSDLGSIAQNTFGGLHAYRTSKCALNMAMKGLSIELAGDGIAVISMAPGWVRTDLGGPSAQWDVDQSVTRQRQALDGLGPQARGCFINLNGDEVPW